MITDSKLATAGIPYKSSGIISLLPVYTACILVWAVDFKAAASGAAVLLQGTVMGVYVLGASYLTMSALRQRIGIGSSWLVLLVSLIFVAESAVVGLGNGQAAYPIFVNALPSLIYASASAITFMTLSTSGKDSRPFLNVLRLACLIFVCVRVIMVILTRGRINLSESRFEVLSGATIPALAIIAIGFVKPISKLDIGILAMNLLVSVISVTRTLVVVVAGQIGAVLITRPSALFKASTMKGMILFGASVLMIVALDLGAGTMVTSRWIQRLTVSHKVGADPTALTRKAEVKFMLNSFSASGQSVLFGNGLAAVTSLTGPDARMAARLVGMRSARLHSIGFGHENYVSILFIAGLLGGGGLLVLMFLNGGQSIALISQFSRAGPDVPEADRHLGLWGAFIVIGTLIAGLFAGTMEDRGTALWYGIGTGMLYWSRDLRWGRSTSAAEPRSPA
jgi:hypothetical protein